MNNNEANGAGASRPIANRVANIQPNQIQLLAQRLKNEYAMAKAATEANDSAKAQKHYATANSIRQILVSYQQQQRARMAAQGQGAAQPQGLPPQGLPPPGALPPGQPQPQAQAQGLPLEGAPQQLPAVQTMATPAQGSPAPQHSPNVSTPLGAAAPGSTVTVETYNQVRQRLVEFDAKVQQLESSKRTYSLTPEQTTNVDTQVSELRAKIAKYQRYAAYMKTQLLEQARANAGVNAAAGSPQAGYQRTTAPTPRPRQGYPAPQGGPGTPGPKGSVSAAGSPPVATPAASAASAAPAATPAAAPTAAAAAAAPAPAGGRSVSPLVRKSASPGPAINLLGITKPSLPSIPILSTINVKAPTAVPLKPNAMNRASLMGGGANGMGQILGTPAILKMPAYELATGVGGDAIPDSSGRVLTKRKLNDLVNTIGADEGDGKTNIDGDVEELLLDLADEFITSVTGFACRLAKHRKVESIDVRDVQLHLERNWNIRIPGYAMDEIKTTRRWQPSPSYTQKVSGVEISRSVNGNIN